MYTSEEVQDLITKSHQEKIQQIPKTPVSQKKQMQTSTSFITSTPKVTMSPVNTSLADIGANTSALEDMEERVDKQPKKRELFKEVRRQAENVPSCTVQSPCEQHSKILTELQAAVGDTVSGISAKLKEHADVSSTATVSLIELHRKTVESQLNAHEQRCNLQIDNQEKRLQTLCDLQEKKWLEYLEIEEKCLEDHNAAHKSNAEILEQVQSKLTEHIVSKQIAMIKAFEKVSVSVVASCRTVGNSHETLSKTVTNLEEQVQKLADGLTVMAASTTTLQEALLSNVQTAAQKTLSKTVTNLEDQVKKLADGLTVLATSTTTLQEALLSNVHTAALNIPARADTSTVSTMTDAIPDPPTPTAEAGTQATLSTQDSTNEIPPTQFDNDAEEDLVVASSATLTHPQKPADGDPNVYNVTCAASTSGQDVHYQLPGKKILHEEDSQEAKVLPLFKVLRKEEFTIVQEGVDDETTDNMYNATQKDETNSYTILATLADRAAHGDTPIYDTGTSEAETITSASEVDDLGAPKPKKSKRIRDKKKKKNT